MSFPSRWVEFHGPCAWKFLHSAAFNWATDPDHPTETEKEDARAFFTALATMMPCDKCGEHYRKYLDQHPLALDSRKSLARWLYDLHADVNRRSGKTGPSFEEVVQDYAGYGPDMRNKFAMMSEAERLRAMADPHFGRPVQRHGGTPIKETMTGSLGNTENIVFIGVSIGLVALVIWYWQSRKRKYD